jgi:hypothetical protein
MVTPSGQLGLGSLTGGCAGTPAKTEPGLRRGGAVRRGPMPSRALAVDHWELSVLARTDIAAVQRPTTLLAKSASRR